MINKLIVTLKTHASFIIAILMMSFTLMASVLATRASHIKLLREELQTLEEHNLILTRKISEKREALDTITNVPEMLMSSDNIGWLSDGVVVVKFISLAALIVIIYSLTQRLYTPRQFGIAATNGRRYAGGRYWHDGTPMHMFNTRYSSVIESLERINADNMTAVGYTTPTHVQYPHFPHDGYELGHGTVVDLDGYETLQTFTTSRHDIDMVQICVSKLQNDTLALQAEFDMLIHKQHQQLIHIQDLESRIAILNKDDFLGRFIEYITLWTN